MTAYIIRYQSDDQGTLGQLLTPSGYQAAVIELPNRDNRSNISRIPAGEYRATWHRSPRFGECYWVRDVEGRSAILTHAGNLAGDTAKGYKTHSYGCILIGGYVGTLAGQKAVLASRPALRKFFEAMEQGGLYLEDNGGRQCLMQLWEYRPEDGTGRITPGGSGRAAL